MLDSKSVKGAAVAPAMSVRRVEAWKCMVKVLPAMSNDGLVINRQDDDMKTMVLVREGA